MHLDFSYKDCDYITVDDVVKVDWDRIYASRGHTLGEGMVSPDSKYFYLNLPKNSSSSIKVMLESIGWTYSNISMHSKAQVLVVLRDPMKRWVSGITEYLMMYQQNIIDNIVDPNNYDFLPLLGEKLGLSLLFDRITFDDHSERQVLFLRDIPFQQCMWFYSDNNFSKNFSDFLNSIGYTNTFDQSRKENSADHEEFVKKRKLQEFISYLIENDEYRKYNLQQWFWCDYKLIEKVNFYGTR